MKTDRNGFMKSVWRGCVITQRVDMVCGWGVWIVCVDRLCG